MAAPERRLVVVHKDTARVCDGTGRTAPAELIAKAVRSGVPTGGEAS